ncbi:MAG: hypothetical protein ACE5PO_09635, partial [Candidatus Bathyarchaeia archaeon]
MKLHVEANKVTVATISKYPFLEEELDSKCKAAGYTVPKRGGTVLIAGRDGSQSLGQVWSKEVMSITYNPARGFLSIEGKSLKEVSQEFATLIHIERELLGNSFDKEVRWGELNFAARSSTESFPLETFSRAPTRLHEGLSELFEERLNPFSVTAYAALDEELTKPLNEIPNWFDLR